MGDELINILEFTMRGCHAHPESGEIGLGEQDSLRGGVQGMYGGLGLFAQGCHIPALYSLDIPTVVPVGHVESWQLPQRALTGRPRQNLEVLIYRSCRARATPKPLNMEPAVCNVSLEKLKTKNFSVKTKVGVTFNRPGAEGDESSAQWVWKAGNKRQDYFQV